MLRDGESRATKNGWMKGPFPPSVMRLNNRNGMPVQQFSYLVDGITREKIIGHRYLDHSRHQVSVSFCRQQTRSNEKPREAHWVQLGPNRLQ